MSTIRIIGDIHGKYDEYRDIISRSDYSVQVGDLGFDYDIMSEPALKQHFFFPGNHDNYDKCFQSPQCLGDWGLRTVNDVSFFFMRGAFSIDRSFRLTYHIRTGRQIWWANEELSNNELIRALDSYIKTKPDIMLTHDAPKVAGRRVGDDRILKSFGFDPETFETKTQVVLDAAFKNHKPKLWIFGHYHRQFDAVIDGTRFICLPELGFKDITKEGEIL